MHPVVQGKPLADDVDAQFLARRTAGFSGAELSNLVNEAALTAAKESKEAISAAIIDEARDKILMGSPRACAFPHRFKAWLFTHSPLYLQPWALD